MASNHSRTDWKISKSVTLPTYPIMIIPFRHWPRSIFTPIKSETKVSDISLLLWKIIQSVHSFIDNIHYRWHYRHWWYSNSTKIPLEMKEPDIWPMHYKRIRSVTFSECTGCLLFLLAIGTDDAESWSNQNHWYNCIQSGWIAEKEHC